MKGVVGGTELDGPRNEVEGTMFGPGCMNDLLFKLMDPVTRHEAAFEKACSYDAIVVEAAKHLWDVPHDAAEVAKCCRAGNCRELTLEETAFKKNTTKRGFWQTAITPRTGVCVHCCVCRMRLLKSVGTRNQWCIRRGKRICLAMFLQGFT